MAALGLQDDDVGGCGGAGGVGVVVIMARISKLQRGGGCTTKGGPFKNDFRSIIMSQLS